MMRAEIFTDGSTRPINPGPSGYGAVVYIDGKVTGSSQGFIGIHGTNNSAEYFGLIAGLDLAQAMVYQLGVTECVFYLDSMLVMNQVAGRWEVSKHSLRYLREVSRTLIKEIEALGVTLTFEHVKGHAGNPGNIEADRLADEAVEERTAIDGRFLMFVQGALGENPQVS